jgi:hypothetical protein
MELFRVHELMYSLRSLSNNVSLYVYATRPEAKPQLRPGIIENFANIAERLGKLGLYVAKVHADQEVQILKLGVTNGEETGMERSAAMIANITEIELSQRVVFFVPPDRSKYYSEPYPFGERVFDRFPSAIADIEAAAKCLALTQGTASVFHSMRVLEVGLKALALELAIPYAPSWESYIRQITDRINDKHPNKSQDWKAKEGFFRDTLGDLTTVKISMRNPTMHIVRHYSPDEAEQVFIAAKGLMGRLASQLSEPPDDAP